MDLISSSDASFLPRTSSVSEDSSGSIGRNIYIGYSIPSKEFDDGLVVLDLNFGGDIVDEHLRPRVKFAGDFFLDCAYGVFDNTVYVFGGFVPESRLSRRRVPRLGEKSVYSYELPVEGYEFIVEKHRLERVCDMIGVKFFPKVIPTPDGKKFVVYSSRITEEQDLCTVELFDPSTKECEALPPLYPYGMGNNSVISHSFITESKLVLQTDRGMYRLDLQGEDWELLRNFIRYIPLNDSEFQIIGGNVCLTEHGVYDIRIDEKYQELASRWVFDYPEQTPLPDVVGAREGQCHLVVVDSKDYNGHEINDPNDSNCKYCTFCIIRLGCVPIERDQYGERYVPHLIVDVYRCDVGSCKMKLEEYRKAKIKAFKKKKLSLESQRLVLPYTLKVRSFRFQLEAQYSANFFIRALSSVLPPSISSVLAAQHLED